MPLSRSNILIVEDQAIIALDLESAVEEANGQVIGPASTVREALKFLHANEVDAAILDANLPDGDVTPVAEALIDRKVPFVINTGVAVPLQLRRQFPLLVDGDQTVVEATCIIEHVQAHHPGPNRWIPDGELPGGAFASSTACSTCA